jgi:hypothetical protein
MPASKMDSQQVLVEALLPTLSALVSEAVKVAMAEAVPASQPKAEKAGKRRKARKSEGLPAFPEGFVKDATFGWKKANGSVGTHRITSIKDGVAHTRSDAGFQGTWKSTTIIAALQTKSVYLVDVTKSPAKDKTRVTTPRKARKPKAA